MEAPQTKAIQASTSFTTALPQWNNSSGALLVAASYFDRENLCNGSLVPTIMVPTLKPFFSSKPYWPGYRTKKPSGGSAEELL